jgi:hypothetical protein
MVGGIPQPTCALSPRLSGAKFIKDTDAVHLYTIDDVLWTLPVVGQRVNFTDGLSKNAIFANDSSLAIGSEMQGSRFPNSLSGVRILTPHRYVEALILLAPRSEPGLYFMSTWISELTYVMAS